MSKTIPAALAVAASMLVLAGTALAGKPSSSLSLVDPLLPRRAPALASASGGAHRTEVEVTFARVVDGDGLGRS